MDMVQFEKSLCFSALKGAVRHARVICVFRLAIVLATALASGCMHYSRGSGTSLEFERIYVAPVKNDSYARQAQALLTGQIREKLANQPNLELALSPENAAVLRITITEINRSVATASKDDTAYARSFDVIMSILCTLVDEKSGKVYFEDYKISDSVECFVVDDYIGAEYQIMPHLTEKLADRVCEAVCNPW
ncbi:MAG: LPS assembly lipoprotein LptE [Puniceicoccales bacterium]|jgi:hypothetical protein|nr:LPS assembly lipoprotein LptE [Puniceicoccales bacterium]